MVERHKGEEFDLETEQILRTLAGAYVSIVGDNLQVLVARLEQDIKYAEQNPEFAEWAGDLVYRVFEPNHPVELEFESQLGTLTLNTETRIAVSPLLPDQENRVRLTPTEAALLTALMLHPNECIGRKNLDLKLSPAGLKVQMGNLKRKLGEESHGKSYRAAGGNKLIHTIYRGGYILSQSL